MYLSDTSNCANCVNNWLSKYIIAAGGYIPIEIEHCGQ